MNGPTLHEIKAQFDGTPVGYAIKLQELKFVNAPYADFVNVVYRLIDYSINEMVREKNILKGLNEDQLTTFFLKPLKNASLNATHETNNGGHCDIVVNGWGSMQWLGEAKIYSDYTKLWGGFEQLRNRYSTGIQDQTSGGLVIYYNGTDAVSMLSNWKDYLLEHLEITVDSDDKRPLEFESHIKHVGSGLSIQTRHMAVVLRHEPTDIQKPPPRTK